MLSKLDIKHGNLDLVKNQKKLNTPKDLKKLKEEYMEELNII